MVFLSVRLRISSLLFIIRITSVIFMNTIHAYSGIAIRDGNLVLVMLRNEVDLPLKHIMGEINSIHGSDIRATSD